MADGLSGTDSIAGADTAPVLTAIVPESAQGQRLDAWLAATFPAHSRSRLKDLILAGAVTRDGTVLTEPKYRVQPGESIALVPPPPVDATPQGEDIALSILYEDAHLLVIDKPAGMVVHPAPGNAGGTLVNALIHHCGDSLSGIGGVRRPGIVHRLDKDTSGVMVVAKTEAAHKALSAQFADHGRSGPLERVYTAFVWGDPQPFRGTVETLIGRDPGNRLKQAVLGAGGRIAITHYRTEARFAETRWTIARVSCALETGRTHQIRVHMAHIGHPLVGDDIYGSGYRTKANALPETLSAAITSLRRQALHAGVLGFAHPETGEALRFSTPLPPDLAHIADCLTPYTR